MSEHNELIEKALNGHSETSNIEYKRGFDVNTTKDWCEIVKDVVAMANSGGGIILFGLEDDGTQSSKDISQVLKLDPAEIVDKINKYTGCQFADFDLKELTIEEKDVAVWSIFRAPIPMVFIRAGNYQAANGRQKTAFSNGTVYLRHGAKSEPGNQNDLREVILREIEVVRKSWLENVRKITDAPPESRVIVVHPDLDQKDIAGVNIRLVDHETGEAQSAIKLSPDITHPYRQNDFVKIVNDRLPDDVEINSYDIQSIAAVNNSKENEVFCYNPKYGSAQYSMAFAEWIVSKYESAPNFFNDCRQKYYRLRYWK